ncbi:uncharacterized protein DS421_5g143140 [Arachis hypogaea]|nr:uncharacterized protein DS421_5g143140 [Arachis hypogaea]
MLIHRLNVRKGYQNTLNLVQDKPSIWGLSPIPSPPSMEEHQHPSIQEQHDSTDTIDMERERRDHLRESILHKELEEALKVKVVDILEVDSAVEELVKEDNKEDFVLEGEEIVEKKIIEDEYDCILKYLDQERNRLPF